MATGTVRLQALTRTALARIFTGQTEGALAVDISTGRRVGCQPCLLSPLQRCRIYPCVCSAGHRHMGEGDCCHIENPKLLSSSHGATQKGRQ